MTERITGFLKESFPGQKVISAPQLCAALGISRPTFWRMRKGLGVVGRGGNGGGFTFDEAAALLSGWLALPNPKHRAFLKNLPIGLQDGPKEQAPAPPAPKIRRTSGVFYGPPLDI